MYSKLSTHAAILLLATSAHAKTCTKGIPCCATCISASDVCHIGQPVTTPTTPAIIAPGAPTSVSATIGNGSASIVFAAPSFNGGVSYLATCSGSAGALSATGFSTPITVSPLVNGASYTCTVLATNSLCNGTVSAGVTVTPNGPAPTGPQALATAQAATVMYSYDDTITVTLNGKKTSVLLSSVDAPELTQAYGLEAKACLMNLIAGKTIAIDVKGQDKYGRTLGVVYANGVDINLAMVQQGCAWMYRQYTSDPAYDSAETAARNTRLGLWSQSNPQSPSDYRHNGATKAAQVFSWASKRYESFFDGSPQISTSADGAERWQFPVSSSVLLSSQGRVSGVIPAAGLNTMVDIGALADFAALAAADDE